MNEITLITHLGLGDLILQSGLAVHLSKTYDRVYFPCRKKDYNSVRSFFLLQPKIEVIVFDVESTTPTNFPILCESLMLGFYSPLGMDKSISFAENFYRQAGVDYAERWDSCPIQEVVNTFFRIGVQHPWFEFVHDDLSRGFKIKYSGQEDRWVEPDCQSSSILAYAGLIQRAQEIHVIDGPFLHLAESVQTTGELFYHRYARPLSARWNDCDVPTRKKWTVLT